MEVPGKSGGSQEYHELCCEPCSKDNGPNLQAVGFCTVCNEHFCGNCIAYHKKMGFTKDHILLGPEEMPKTKPSKTRSQRQMKLSPEEECVDACDEHKGELVKYFCNDHQKLGCMDCMVLNHGVCDKSLISDISCTEASIKQYDKFRNDLTDVRDTIVKEAQRAKENIIQVDDIYQEAWHQKDAFISEIQKKLSVLDFNTEKEAKTRKEIDNKKLCAVNESCKSIQKDIETVSKEFDVLGKGNKKSQQFTLMKKCSPKVEQWEESCMTLTTENNFVKYTFAPNRSIIDCIDTASALGELETERGTKEVQLNRQKGIPVGSNEGSGENKLFGFFRKRKGETGVHENVIRKVIHDYREVVMNLKDQEIETIESVPYVVEIKVDKQNGVITIRGPTESISAANDNIQKELRRIERHQRRVEKAKLLTQQVKWYYENVTWKSIELKEYDMHTNLSIEEAFKKNEKTYQISDTDGNVYVIDFEMLTEYPISDSSDTVRVVRKDILISESTAVPKEWTPMKDNKTICVVALHPTDQIYKDIEKEFLTQTRSGKYSHRIQVDVRKLQVTKIERIQNKTLYQQYMAKKKLMTAEKGDKLPPSMPIEWTVWHGTKNESITSIQTLGFNRSYCGVNGIWYGAGVYFSGDPAYSARGWLSGAGGNAPQASPVRGTIFYVKALTGQYCKGNQSMRYLPPIDPSKPLVLYDSAVDNPANPMEFVIFNDTQAYPEYLITFTA